MSVIRFLSRDNQVLVKLESITVLVSSCTPKKLSIRYCATRTKRKKRRIHALIFVNQSNSNMIFHLLISVTLQAPSANAFASSLSIVERGMVPSMTWRHIRKRIRNRRSTHHRPKHRIQVSKFDTRDNTHMATSYRTLMCNTTHMIQMPREMYWERVQNSSSAYYAPHIVDIQSATLRRKSYQPNHKSIRHFYDEI